MFDYFHQNKTITIILWKRTGYRKFYRTNFKGKFKDDRPG